MPLKNYLFLLGSLCLVHWLTAQSFNYYPTSTNGQVVDHDYYALSYSEAHEQAEWVAYHLTRERVQGNYERTDNYRYDPNIASGSARLRDYKGSGYDRGHLAPAKAMAFNSSAMSRSFYLSNMSPMDASFNRGIWRQLEKQVRQWAHKNEEVYVVSGPVLNRCIEYIGPNQVCVPNTYYKVVLDYKRPERKAIAFLLPNKKGNKDLAQYAVAIDQVEQRTGIDFFHHLPDREEEQLESQANTHEWDFDAKVYTPSSNDQQNSAAKRCKGETNSGRRCKRTTTSENQYCWQHNDQAGGQRNQYDRDNREQSEAVRCKGRTNDGDRCKRRTKNASGYCWQHE